MEKFTKDQFEALFHDEETCLDTIFKNRFGDLAKCPGCKSPLAFIVSARESVTPANGAVIKFIRLLKLFFTSQKPRSRNGFTLFSFFLILRMEYQRKNFKDS